MPDRSASPVSARTSSPTWLFGGWTPDFSRSPWTVLLVAVTVTVGIVQCFKGWDVVMAAMGFVPAAVWAPSTWFAILPGQSTPVALTWFTYVFPHMAWWHMAGNLIGLLMFGSVVEPMMGTRRYAAVTVAATILGVFGLAAIHPKGDQAIAGGSLLLCAIVGIWLAAFTQGWWRKHQGRTVALEAAVLAGLIAWLLIRETPLEATGPTAILWHVPPLLLGWFGFRAGSAIRS